MNFFFEVAVNALESFLILDFLKRYFGYKNSLHYRSVFFCIFWIISTCSITYFSWNESFEIFSSLSQVIINIVFCLLLLKEDIWPKVFISSFTMGGVILIASFSTFFIGHLNQYSIEDILTQFNSIRVIAICTSKVIFFQVTRIILRIKSCNRISLQDYLPLIVIPIISICTISILTHIAITYIKIQQPIFFAVCLIIILNLLTYHLFIRISKTSQLKHDYELLNLQYSCVTQNAEEIKHMYDNIRSMRHDMKNHLLYIANILQDHPDDRKQALNYIQRLINQQESSQRKIVFSGNDSLDAILNSKQIAAQPHGIKFDIVIAHSLHFMAPEDICVLFGNLFDNAIAAAKHSDAKLIKLNIQPQGSYVSIMLANSTNLRVLKNNPTLETTKINHEGHGYGIKNIRKVVQRYHGLIRFYEENEMFVCDILLLTIDT